MPTTGERNAIETRYAGCRFRSRLEARWAVFFDKLGIGWEYEPQGYRVGGTPYLPDFWLPKMRQWVEVKGSTLNLRERVVMAKAVFPGGGLPYNLNGVLLLGSIPDVRVSGVKVAHPRFFFHEGDLYRNPFYFSEDTIDDPPEWRVARAIIGRTDQHLADLLWVSEASSAWSPTAYINDPHVTGFTRRKSTPAERRVAKAYVAARSARFEHGERG
jgi:hypothetical protein